MDVLHVISWWLLFLCFGLIVLPICSVLFRRLADRGYGFARIIGYLAVAYLMFVTSTARIFKFSVLSILLCVAVILLAQVIFFTLKKDARKEMLAWFKSRDFWLHALLEELLFLLMLALWSYLRGCAPDLHDLEKYMNIGFINSMLNTDFMPAQDMWFAGASINYYYFGHFCAANAIKLSGMASDVGYNLMMATLFAATFTATFSLSYGLLRLRRFHRKVLSVVGGLISSVMVCLSGNLHYFVYGLIPKLLHGLGLTDAPDSYWFADATRYIGYNPPVEKDLTITEFPLYSFIVSDLHAHVMNVLPVLVFLAVALMFVLSEHGERDGLNKPLHRLFIPSPYVVVMGVIIGLFSMTNFWDFPIYMVVSLFLFAYCGWLRYGFSIRLWISCGYRLILLYLIQSLISLPFNYGFEAMFSGIGLVKTRSEFYQLLVLHGLPLLIGLIFALWLFFAERGQETLPALSRRQTENLQKKGGVRARPYSLANFAPYDIFVLVMFICAFGLAFGTEFVYVRDIYEDAYPRANTMFKLSYQAFILYSIGLGYVFGRMVDCRRRILKSAAMATAFLLCFASLISYAPVAITTWYGDAGEDNYRGLSGESFIRDFATVYDGDTELNPEYEALCWIRENTPADAVVLESYGDSYTDYCFISAFSGRATVVGWQTHEWLWRNSYEVVAERQAEVDAVYMGKPERADVVDKYGIDYIYVGKCERERYGGAIAQEDLLSYCEVVFTCGEVCVYRVKQPT